MTLDRHADEFAELAATYGLGAGADAADVLELLLSSGDQPVTLVNLFALRDQAEYARGEDDAPCSGVEAMLRYSARSGARLEAVGGRFVHQGLSTSTLWGDTRWDVIVVAEYPNAAAVLELLRDPEYRDTYRHRRAAVARQLVTASVSLG